MSNETEAAAMTDPKLLPLPEGVDVIFSPDGNGAALDVFTAEQVQDYARANVAHATAAKDAEIEALKSDLGDYMDAANYQAARAERLAEALRGLVAYVRETAHHNAPAAAAARAALRDHDQEGKDG